MKCNTIKCKKKTQNLLQSKETLSSIKNKLGFLQIEERISVKRTERRIINTTT